MTEPKTLGSKTHVPNAGPFGRLRTGYGAPGEMVQGTLDMLILRTLVMGRAHGHTIARVIESTSKDVLQVEQGSLYPALHRLEDREWVRSSWGVSENNRKAKFYELTAMGRKQLAVERKRWQEVVAAIGRILGESTEESGVVGGGEL